MNKIEVVNVDERKIEDYSIQELIDMDWKEYLRIANYNKDPYKMCEECIAEQKRKYGGRTPIICNGLKDYKTALSHKYSEEVIEAIEKEMSEEELLEIKGAFSAPEWFRAHIKDSRTYSPRFHQDLVMKCSAKYKVIRMGRRCILGTEEVQLRDRKIPIKDVKVGDEVVSLSEKGERIFSRVVQVYNNGLSERLYELSTLHGHKVRLTHDHQVRRAQRGLYGSLWLSIEEGLQVGDTIIVDEGGLRVDVITEIKEIPGKHEVYDLEVYGVHNYVAGGVLVHNCGKTFSVILDIIHRVETADRPLNILVSAPLITMITEIEATLMALTQAIGRPDFIVSKKASPILEVKFFNGSKLQGITLSNDGTSARGKKADLLWVDEMDFVNRKALEALQAIEMDNPNVEVMYTSTPIGQGNLYNAEMMENTKAFHFPSYVIPHFSDSMHEAIKKKLSDIAFAQECFVGDTEVLTTKGVKPIKDIVVGDEVYYDTETIVPVIQNARVTGTKEVVRYSTYNKSFVCTPDHKFPDRGQAKTEIQHLQEVPVLRQPYNRNNREEVLARVIGFNMGDGTITSTRETAHFYSSNKEDLQELLKDLQYLYPEYNGNILHKRCKTTGVASKYKDEYECYWLELGKENTKELISLGCPVGKKVEQQFSIPPFVKNGSTQVKIEFIAALMGAEGFTPRPNERDTYPRITGLMMTKRKCVPDGRLFFEELKELVEGLGIPVTITRKEDEEFNSYQYWVYLKDTNLFTKLVGYRYCHRKEVANFKYACYLDYIEYSINEKGKLRENILEPSKAGLTYPEIAKQLGTTRSTVGHVVRRGQTTAKRALTKDLDTFSVWCSKQVVGDTVYVPIIRTESQGVEVVYNIGVGSADHSYMLANNIKTFNCLGLYGLDEAGVFQIHYIENCIENYIPDAFNEAMVLRDRSRFIVFLGVDWNHDLNGTRIVITAYDKNTDKFFVVEKAKIAKQNLTQAIAVDKVVELNRKYQADHIICDEGFGIGQVSELRTRGREQYGKVPANHPDLRLVDTMSVQFGSSLEIKDPTTHEVMKKNTKQYIVENTQKILEERRLAFNDVDDNELIMQMKNYTVVSSGLRGNKYKARDKKIGDHDLDAFMLCLYGYDYHYGEYIKPRLVEYGTTVKPQGVQYQVPGMETTAILARSLGRSGTKRKPFKTRKVW